MSEPITSEPRAESWITDVCANRSDSFRNALMVVQRIVAERHDRPSLVSRIACEIGSEIIENIRPAGQDLNSVELAQFYETSRTPIREALMLLEKEGLVDIPPRRRPRVAILNIEDVRDIYPIRAVLFGKVAADVAEGATDPERAELRAVLGKMGAAFKCKELSAYLWANVEFYNCLTNAAHNRTAKRILDSLLLRTLRLRRLSLSQPQRLEKSMSHHIQLIEAIEDRDAPLAAALIRSNHLHALAALESYLVQRGPKRTASRRGQLSEPNEI